MFFLPFFRLREDLFGNQHFELVSFDNTDQKAEHFAIAILFSDGTLSP